MTAGHFPPEGQTDFDAENDPATDSPDPAGGGEQSAAAPGGDGAAAPEPGEVELTASRARVDALTEDLQRLQAEYVNYKRRVDRDRELVLENAKYSVLASLMPVLDDVDRAREHGELSGGFKAVADALERIVSAQGLTKFGAPGDDFDPRFHEALMHAHSAEVTTTACRDIVTAGYLIGERVVRPARVTVVGPEPSDAS